ncbi:hypothetical protein BDN72DRAFT_907499 [Pluteus cervinus]|uniref:Uncharacterized protein n=1 Tax=Pluteus cervinus TaxID=181527 RepID=A0ACD2ZWX2_9AGAR|nr:hypothetical protein BDN72DRAFT_907499 [Pluteus cervinus]
MPPRRSHTPKRSSPYLQPSLRRSLRLAARQSPEDLPNPDAGSHLPFPTTASDNPILPLFPRGDVPSTYREAVDSLQEWIRRPEITTGLDETIRNEFAECTTMLVTRLLDIVDSVGRAAKVRQSLLQPLQCSVCLDTFKRPVTLSCSHTFCEDCICRAFQSLFESNAQDQLSEIFTEKISGDIVREFSMDDPRRFGLFLTIFVRWQGVDFVKEMMRYNCPLCRKHIQRMPEDSEILSRVRQ